MKVGQLTKDSADETRVTVDFTSWLDNAEVITGATMPVVVVEQTTTCLGTTPPPPVDTTPLLVASTTVVGAGLQVQMLLTAGTPGLTYKITFVASGSTSSRQKQVDILVSVRPPL